MNGKLQRALCTAQGFCLNYRPDGKLHALTPPPHSHVLLHRLNKSVSKLRGQCYDGASAISGSQGGVATIGFSVKSLGLCTHTAMAML